MTNDEFLDKVKTLRDVEYTILEPYVDSRVEILIKHEKCGREFKAIPFRFLAGKECPYCAKEHRKKSDAFKEKVSEMYGNEYTFLEKYVDAKTKILVRHNLCGNEYRVSPNKFLCNRKCPKCAVENVHREQRLSQEEFEARVAAINNGQFSVCSEYFNNQSHITLHCNLCNKNFRMLAYNFMFRKQCPHCNKLKSRIKPHEQFVKEVYDLFGTEFEIISEYSGSHIHLLVKHNECGHMWNILPTNLLRGYGCPYCSSPKGERAIQKILKQHKIPFECQYVVDGCNGNKKHPLFFDFAIFRNNELWALIEFDGEQHYKPVELFGGLKFFQEQVERDQIKNLFCKENNIKLLRIPYHHLKNINLIFDQIFKRYFEGGECFETV